MRKIVLLRHGESVWNKENRFTGWTDVNLSEKGEQEAEQAGKWLLQEGFSFDLAFASVLKRAIRTLWITLDQLDLQWIPVEKNWRLNERHYGALQGLNKAETAKEYGEDQVKIWRRSYDIPPPALLKGDKRHPSFDLRYRGLSPNKLPTTESLKITLERVLPFWTKIVVPELLKNKRILIVAHGNSLRALVKMLDHLSDKEILEVNIPTGIPLVYDLDDNMKATNHYYLGDSSTIEKAMHLVASQGKISA